MINVINQENGKVMIGFWMDEPRRTPLPCKKHMCNVHGCLDVISNVAHRSLQKDKQKLIGSCDYHVRCATEGCCMLRDFSSDKAHCENHVCKNKDCYYGVTEIKTVTTIRNNSRTTEHFFAKECFRCHLKQRKLLMCLMLIKRYNISYGVTKYIFGFDTTDILPLEHMIIQQ